jgi:hypothetical protein
MKSENKWRTIANDLQRVNQQRWNYIQDLEAKLVRQERELEESRKIVEGLRLLIRRL